ncbi:MAG TPA: hypothetical protein VN397_02195 [Candidatus Methylomirabilis sp.]|nr:hypothetical protein [Candidatus Methylomirabilis sp.]
MNVVTVVILVVIALLCVGMFVVGTKLFEYDKGFTWFAYGMLALLAAFAVYLAFAVPSVAKLSGVDRAPVVTQEATNLLND